MTAPRRLGRRRAIIVLALAVLGGVVGGVVSARIDRSYAATTVLLIGALDGPDLETSAMIATIDAGLVRDGRVLAPVNERLGLGSDWQALRDRVHVDLDENGAPIITVTTYGRSAAEAAALASAITERVQEITQPTSRGPAPQPVVEASPITVGAIRAIEGRLARLEAARVAAADGARSRILGERIERQSDLLVSWQRIYAAERSRPSGSTSADVQVLQPAEPAGGVIRPRVPINIALGAAIGALLGCCVSIVDSIRGRDPREDPNVGGTVDDPWARELDGPQTA